MKQSDFNVVMQELMYMLQDSFGKHKNKKK